MTPPQTDIKMQLAELSANAFEAFCTDISGMFGVEMATELSEASTETAKGLLKSFKKLAAIITIKARGVLDGEFHIVFDKEGLFTLAGTIVMLPEQRIVTTRKTGSAADAEELHDAVGEAGNLLVGSWDRIFREELEGHIHFLQTGTFIGNPWEDAKKNLGLSDEEAFLFFPCEMTVGSFPAFKCGVIFPEAVLQKKSEEPAAAIAEPEPDSDPIEASVAEEPKTQETPVISEPPAEPDIQAAANLPEAPAEPDTPEPVVALDPPAEPDIQETAVGAVTQTIQKMVQSLPILPGEDAQTLLSVWAKDIMKKEVLWGNPDDSVQLAMEKMQQADAACMLIGNSDSPEGIVTWIDIAEAVSVYLRPVFSKWRRPSDDATLQIKMKVIMTRPVRTIKQQTPLAVVLEDMCLHRLRCLPVVDDHGKVTGVVTPFDIFKFLMRLNPELYIADPAS